MARFRRKADALDAIKRILRTLRNMGSSMRIRTFSVQELMAEWGITEQEVRKLESEIMFYENHIV